MRRYETSPDSDRNCAATDSSPTSGRETLQGGLHSYRPEKADTVSLICPSCRRADQARKINAVLVAEASDASTPQPSAGPSCTLDGESPLTVVGTYTTFFGRDVIVLSQRLCPSIHSNSWGVGCVIVIPWGFVGLLILSAGIDISPLHSALLAFTAAPALIFFAIKVAKRFVELPRWTNRRELYYCPPCESVFSPGDRFIVDSQILMKLLSDERDSWRFVFPRHKGKKS